MAENHEDQYGMTSPGGFVFGISGWHWGEPRPKSITFFLDGTAKVCDQHGRPIRGSVGADNKPVLFAPGPPDSDGNGGYLPRPQYATHAQVIAALEADRIDWRKLVCAGWPQLPYAELKKLPQLPATPLEELRRIKDQGLRRDALRIRREADEARAAEMQATAEE